MSEHVCCRITGKGNYLGYQCPIEGLNITYSTYKLMRAMGVPIEIYDPVKEAKEKELKKAQKEAENVVVEEVVEVKEDVVEVEENTEEIIYEEANDLSETESDAAKTETAAGNNLNN